MRAAADLADAAGRVINNTGLGDLESAIAKLNLKLVIYDKAVEEATCQFCPLPCLSKHCCTNKENGDEKDEKS